MYTRPTPKETEARSPSKSFSLVVSDKQISEQIIEEKKPFNYKKEWLWQKGQSGNPRGRPKGKTLKEFTREFLFNMSEEARIEFFKTLSPDLVWRMAEGNPKQDMDVKGTMEHQIVGMRIQKDSNPQLNGAKAN